MTAALPSAAETPRLARHFGRDGPSSVKSLTTCRTNQLRQHSEWQRPHSLQANQARSTRQVAAKSRLARNWDANPPSLIASRSVSATSRPRQSQILRKSCVSCHSHSRRLYRPASTNRNLCFNQPNPPKGAAHSHKTSRTQNHNGRDRRLLGSSC